MGRPCLAGHVPACSDTAAWDVERGTGRGTTQRVDRSPPLLARRRAAGRGGLQPGQKAGQCLSAHCQPQRAGADLAFDDHRAGLDGPRLGTVRRPIGDDFKAASGECARRTEPESEDAEPRQFLAGGTRNPEGPTPAPTGGPKLQAHIGGAAAEQPASAGGDRPQDEQGESDRDGSRGRYGNQSLYRLPVGDAGRMSRPSLLRVSSPVYRRRRPRSPGRPPPVPTECAGVVAPAGRRHPWRRASRRYRARAGRRRFGPPC
jgi:hypothetical protein